MSEKIIISESQLKNAIVYGDRWAWAKKLPHNINFMEVGVAAGDFSHFVASNVTLSNLYLVDKYNHIDYRTGWDHIEGIRFDQNTHYDFVSDRFQDFDNVTMLKGSSEDILKDLVDKNKIKFGSKLDNCPVCLDTKTCILLNCSAHYICSDCYIELYNKPCPVCRL